MKKYYGVKQGRKVGVFDSWGECKSYVHGYPDAKYKSFPSFEEAYFFVYGKHVGSKKEDNEERKRKEVEMRAYIDGSYEHSIRRFGYAGIMLHGAERIEFANSEDTPELVDLRNIAGELKAAMYVMNYAKKNAIKSVAIYYDYAGIENWATGVWKANKEFTKAYVDFTRNIMDSIEVVFIKVRAHSGDELNEAVDMLAKKSLLAPSDDFHAEMAAHKEIKAVEIEKPEPKFWDKVKGTKKSLNVSFIKGEEMISPDELYSALKEKWKSGGRNLRDIKEMKAAYDVGENRFVIEVSTDTSREQIVLDWTDISY